MELLYCPVCSQEVSSDAVIAACPNCSHPFDAVKWRDAKAKKVAEENAKILGQLLPHDKKERITSTTKAKLRQAYNEQKKSGNAWTFYNENDIVQRTLENRFNFLLIAYTIFVTAYFQADYDIEKFVILSIGLALLLFLSLGIRRTTKRFNITLDIVHSLEDNDVGPVIHTENLNRHHQPFDLMFRKNSIHGKYIPAIMLITFGGGIAFHIVKYILQKLEIIPTPFFN